MLVGSAILTFDISRGDVVEARYPNAPFAISDDELSALAVPEGAHHTQEDHTYIVTQDAAGEPLYGLCCFLNRRDPSAPRGACMKSIVVLSKGPYFSFYLPILRVALNRYMDGLSDAASVLHTLVDRINEVASSRTMDALSLWGASFAVDMPSLPPEHVGGASLLGLVRQFREDTMLLWWAVLLQQRLLFTGQPASAVGACCLAAPLLAAPLRGLLEITSPYVPLAHPAPIEGVGAGGRYICGATNAIFGQKPQWFDALASLGSGTVSGALVDTLRVRVAGSQLRFIKNVLTAVERDGRAEAWVREQFRQHTEAFLLELIMAEEQGRDLKFSCAAISREVWRLTASPGFLGYRASRATSEEPSAALAAAAPQRKRALEYYEMLSAATTASASSGDRSKLLFNLHSTLSDLVDIEALVDAGAVRTLSASHFLQSESGTIRKYATGVLAVLCSTIRGQVAALTAELLPTFVAMLADPMPAVSAAAANALCKSASLFVGAQALVDYGTVPQLMEMLLRPASEELLLRTLIASTLLQLYTHLPSTPRIPNAIPDVASLLLTLAAARELGVVLLQLLDVWGGVSEAVGLHALETTATIGSFVADIPGVAAHVRAISAVGPTQMQSVAALQADLTSRRWLGVPLVLAGAVEGLGEAVRGGKLPLARASLLTLAILADTDIGRHRIVSGPLLPWLIATLEPAVATPSSAHATGRLLEVVAQHDDGAARLVALGVPAALVTLCAAYLPRHGRGAPCVPALGTLSHLRRNAGHGASVIAALEPLAELDVSSVGEHEAREALATLLASMGLGRMPSPSSPSARSSAATPRSPVFA